MRAKWWMFVGVAIVGGTLLAAEVGKAVVEKVQSKSADGKVRECQRDWTNQVVTVTGEGPLTEANPSALAKVRAKRVATGDAYRLLAETIAGVRVTSETTIKNYELVSDDIHTKVSALVRGARVVAEKLGDDGIYRVTMSAPLFGDEGSLASVVIPAIQDQEEPARQQQLQTEQAAGREPLPALDIPVEQPAAPALPDRRPGPYTGLVVDARGFELMPAMSPKVVKQDGSEVWGTMHVDPQFVLATGIVSWVTDLDDAGKRAGDNPLIVRAVGRHGSFRADPVIEDGEAELVLAENAKSKFLDQCRVSFVVDPAG